MNVEDQLCLCYNVPAGTFELWQREKAAEKNDDAQRSAPPASRRAARAAKRPPKPAARRSSPAKSKPSPPGLNDGQRSLLVGIIILFLTAVLTLSLLSPNQGQFTEWLSRLAALAFGIGRITLPLVTGGIGIFLVLRGMEQEPEVPYLRLLGGGCRFLRPVDFRFAGRLPTRSRLRRLVRRGRGRQGRRL